MPRPLRRILAGEIYHVVNRGNEKRVIFSQDADYKRFLELLRLGREHGDVSILGFCPMPTHFHLLLGPKQNDALSAYMHWVTSRYACDLRCRTGTRGSGHVFQRRFWASPVRDATHFLTVLRYIEGNALRARIVSRAEDWRWGSLVERRDPASRLLNDPPVCLPSDWETWVNLGQDEFVVEMIRRDLRRVR